MGVTKAVNPHLPIDSVYSLSEKSMTTEFSYPALRCIIEYLEANKRTHICARSKFLQKFEKSIPLHINRLELSGNVIYLNSICYDFWSTELYSKEKVFVDGEFREWYGVLMPGDILLKETHVGSPIFKLEDYQNAVIQNPDTTRMDFGEFGVDPFCTDIKLPPAVVQKILLNTLFGQRGMIHVSSLELQESIIRLPESIKFRIRNTLNMNFYDFVNLLPMIDQSFPLKKIELDPWNPEMYYHPIVQNAEAITIHSQDVSDFLEPWHKVVLTLPHKHINLKWYPLEMSEMIIVIQDWLDHPRDVGNTLKVVVGQPYDGRNFAYIKTHCNGTLVSLPVRSRGDSVYPRAFSIPLNFISELVVREVWYGHVELEVVSAGSTIPIKEHYMSYESIQMYFYKHPEQQSWALVVIISVVLIVFAYVLYHFKV